MEGRSSSLRQPGKSPEVAPGPTAHPVPVLVVALHPAAPKPTNAHAAVLRHPHPPLPKELRRRSGPVQSPDLPHPSGPHPLALHPPTAAAEAAPPMPLKLHSSVRHCWSRLCLFCICSKLAFRPLSDGTDFISLQPPITAVTSSLKPAVHSVFRGKFMSVDRAAVFYCSR